MNDSLATIMSVFNYELIDSLGLKSRQIMLSSILGH
jgi:hypothetical protein